MCTAREARTMQRFSSRCDGTEASSRMPLSIFATITTKLSTVRLAKQIPTLTR